MNSLLQPEICHASAELNPSELAQLDRTIADKELGISVRSDHERWLEATLFIDKEFLAVEAIAGRKRGFERLLGNLEWEGYLDAKFYCDNYGRQPLTPEFLLGIHREFLARQAPHVAGTYATGSYRGGRVGSSGEFLPLAYSQSEVDEIHANPLLHFEVTGSDPRVGFLNYEARSQQGHEEAIADVCEWYNSARGCDPIERAALLERKLIERHAYAYGICGRVARMAMNWSLLYNDRPPSALLNFNNDILVPKQQWVEEVRQGCERHQDMASLLPAYLTISPIDFFGFKPLAITQERYGIEQPVRLEPDQRHNKGHCSDFLGELAGKSDFAVVQPRYQYVDRGVVVQVLA